MPPKDFLDHCDMEIDEDLEIIEEIAVSSTSTKKTKFNQITPAHLSFKQSAKEELKQANNKISQQKDTILELQQKLKYQNGKLQTSTQIIANQRRLLLTAQKEKLKLRRSIAIEKKRGNEKLSKLLDFFNHINNEFSFAIDVLAGNKITGATTATRKTFTIKQLKPELKSKLEQLKNLEIERTKELDDAKKMLADIPVQKIPITTATSTQTNVTSEDINNYLTECHSPDQTISPIVNQPPIRLRLKRAYYDKSAGNINDNPFESPPISPSEYLQETKYANAKRINTTSQVLAMNNAYYSSATKHELDTTKQNLDLFYCTCGLTFGSKKWLSNHTNLFLTFYSGDVKEFNQDLPQNSYKNQSNQTSVIVSNLKK